MAALIRGTPIADSEKVATATSATIATLEPDKVRTVARVATVAVASPPEARSDALPDPAAEARRQRVLAMLQAHPEVRYAAVTDTQAVSGFVLLALAIRDLATVDLLIPCEKWDGVLFLDLLERHGGTLH